MKFTTIESLMTKINKDGYLAKDSFALKALKTMSKTSKRTYTELVASYISERYKVSNEMATEAASRVL